MIRPKAELIEQLTNPGVIAVIRTERREQVLPVAEALIAGGLTAIEITMTTPDAIGAIREASEKLGDRVLIGVGTVLDPTQCRAAIAVGAQFVVSPICLPELSLIAHTARCLMIMGAYTPTEVQLAHETGADFVKLFPADGLGVAYIKALRAPLPHLRIIPTGGVDVNNLAEYFKAGCPAVGVGSSLISQQILQTSDWPELTRRAAEFVRRAKAARSA
ncbi:MAG: bifunctional 4-hydroxy-2-oxoglutarate aldolase/2-dehydro-3-deoxy-phosphogluconate aldolase [Verrucomicrobiota bacterium]